MAKVNHDDPETILVAGALIDPALSAEAAAHVQPEDFQSPAMRMLWAGISRLVEAGKEVDPVSLAAECATSTEVRHKIARRCGDLLDGIPRRVSLVEVAKRVRRGATLRKALQDMRSLAIEIKNAAETPGADVENLEERLSILATGISERGDKDTRRTAYADVAKEVSDYFDNIATGPAEDAIRTGLHRLDSRLGGGLRPGRLYSIVAPTGAGKSALASQVADYATYQQKRALMFSMEMDPLDVFIRDTERIAGRSRWDLRAAAAITREKSAEDLVKAQAHLLGRTGKIVYGEPMSAEGIRQTILTERMRGGPVHLVVVDHAQVVAPNAKERKQMPRYLEVKNVAEALRHIAQTLDIVVLMTVQMNPPAKGESPSMYLARESKDLVHVSDAVLVLYHEKDEVQDGDITISASWILVEKIRAGNPGRVQVKFDGRSFCFSDYHQAHEEPLTPGQE